jgi:hypothetical protein
MLTVKEAINLILENTPDKVDLSQKELLEAKGVGTTNSRWVCI